MVFQHKCGAQHWAQGRVADKGHGRRTGHHRGLLGPQQAEDAASALGMSTALS